jgi:hypothetical protein
MAAEPEEGAAAPTENGHAEQPVADGDANHAKKSKAAKKKDKRKAYKQNKQQRR